MRDGPPAAVLGNLYIAYRKAQASILGNLGIAYKSLGEYDKAIEYQTRSLELATQIGDLQRQANSYGNLGNAYQSLGEYDKAIENHTRHLELVIQIDDVAGQGRVWNNLGVALKSLKRYRDALTCYLKAMPIRKRIGNPQDVEQTHRNIANLRTTVGEAAWSALETEAQHLAADGSWRPGIGTTEGAEGAENAEGVG